MKDLNSYGKHSIDEMIKILQDFKKVLGGKTLINLSDYEFNGRQRNFEICRVEGEKELFIVYEMHESQWGE